MITDDDVLAYVRDHPMVSDKDIAKAYDCKTRRVLLCLRSLSDAGKVEAVRSGSSMLWALAGVKGTKIALYARVSTSDQDETLQLPRLRQAAQHRGVIIGEWTDEASGRDLNRPGWSSLLESVRAGRVDEIHVTKLDRIVRNLQLLLQELEEIGRYGVTIVTLDMGTIDPSSPSGRLQLQMLGMVAEWERGIISARTKEALAVKRSQGVQLGRPAAKVPIRTIALYRMQGMSWRDIAGKTGIKYGTIYAHRHEVDAEITELSDTVANRDVKKREV